MKKKRMINPLIKRVPKELIGEWRKYLVIFLLLSMTIGFVSGMFAFDRWMGMQQHQLRAIIEERTGKTVFLYDTDFWNQESFSRDRMETAVETLSYIL